jgi:hypothetical protein
MHGSLCDHWIMFWGNDLHKGKPRYGETLHSIVFADRHHFVINASQMTRVLMLTSIKVSAKNNRALRRLAAGHWMKFPPAKEGTYLVNRPLCIRVWGSPLTEGRDHEPETVDDIVVQYWRTGKSRSTIFICGYMSLGDHGPSLINGIACDPPNLFHAHMGLIGIIL